PRSAPATRWRRNTAASCTRYCINPLLPDGALIWPTCRPQAGYLAPSSGNYHDFLSGITTN
ncbi:hypothetical protein LTSEUGA_0792, partial [Salmonella enterica subsp. enterica serovar Uganda str. R8-3404]